MLNIQQIAKTDATLLPTLLKSIEDNRVFKKVSLPHGHNIFKVHIKCFVF